MGRTARFDNGNSDFSRSRVRHDIRTIREETIFRDITAEDLLTEDYDIRRLMDKL